MADARIILAARALYRDATQHIKPPTPFDALPFELRWEWQRKATVALTAAGVVRRG